jgi:hypothetical protein
MFFVVARVNQHYVSHAIFEYVLWSSFVPLFDPAAILFVNRATAKATRATSAPLNMLSRPDQQEK